MDMANSDGKGVDCTRTGSPPHRRRTFVGWAHTNAQACMWGWGWGRAGLAAIAVMAGVVATPVRAVATINPVPLPSATCPSNLNSCTANDVVTTVKAVDILNNDICNSLNDTIDLRITNTYTTTATQRFDLGLFVSGDGGTVQEPSSALVCFGAAAQAGQGNDNAYPDADTDLFLSLDPLGSDHSDTPNTTDTCGDLAQNAGPVDWTVDVNVKCNIVNNQLIIPSCRVWEQNGKHKVSCTTLQQAGTGSKCDCTNLVVTTQLNPCATKICNDNDVCTNDSCEVVHNPDGTLSGKCVFTPGNAGTECRPANGVCDVAEACDGINPGCPADGFAPSTTTCRASAGQCDVAESCTGTSGACPTDGFAPSTTACTGTSNGGACDGTDSCDGAGKCVDGFKPSTTICRAAAGQCDVAESCTGTSSACPENTFQPKTTACTGTSNGGACDGTDSCDGAGNCVDGFQPATTICRAAAGQCDVAESCTGTSGACPENTFQPKTTTCTGTSNGGACDGEDSCDGAGSCMDAFQPATTICRASAGQCDVAESCTGTSGACPENTFQPKTTTCTGTSNGGACDGEDSCDGAGSCMDAFQPATTICRASAGQCDVAESCTGTGGACPPDVNPVCQGKIAPTATTCQNFTGGTAGDLTQLLYGVKSNKINSVSPGVLFYYSRVTAPASSFTIQVVQTKNNATFPFLGIQQGQVKLYNADCSNSSLGTFTTSGGVTTITVTGATPGAVFVVGVKYNPGTVVGTTVGASPPTVHYDFSTEVNGVLVAADPDGLNLAPKP